MASCDPIESPSGRECEESTNRFRERIASTMRCSGASLFGVIRRGVVGGRVVGRRPGVKLVEDAFDAILAGDRIVIDESELRGAFESQPRPDLTTQERRRPAERAGARFARLG